MDSDSEFEFSSTLEKKLYNFWEEKFETDVDFAVKDGDDWTIQSAHKIVLSLWSPVLAAMLEDGAKSTIKVNDIDPQAFKTMLRFLYGCDNSLDRHKRDTDLILGVYKASIKYEIQALEKACREIFEFSMPNELNVFDLLEAARLIMSSVLEQRCLKFLHIETHQILHSKHASRVTTAMMKTILQQPAVSFDSEEELMMFVFAWSKQRSEINKPADLKELVPFLSFTSLTPKGLAKLVANHYNKGIFDEKEGFAFFMNILNERWPLPHWYSGNLARTYGAK